MGLRQVCLEFEFVDDDSGGKLVASGNVVSVLLGALAEGDVDSAAQLYEESGEGLGAELMAELQTASSTTRDNLARMFERARDFPRAAIAHEHCRRWKEAAAMYERALDFANAGRCHLQAGDALAAARALEKAGQVGQALELYAKAGAQEAKADCLARNGMAHEAAELYAKLGNKRGEAEALRLVPPDSQHWLASTRRLAELMEGAGRLDLATRVLLDAMRVSAIARDDQAACLQLLRLFGRQGIADQAERVRAHLARLGAAPQPEAQAPAAAPGAVDLGLGPPPADGYEMLKAIPIFAELSFADMKDLFRVSREASWNEGQAIIGAGVEPPGLTVILEGEVVVTAVDDPKRTLNTLGPGAYVGEISLIRRGPTTANVVARTPVRALTISPERFEQFLFGHEAAALRIYRLFANNLADRVVTLSSK